MTIFYSIGAQRIVYLFYHSMKRFYLYRTVFSVLCFVYVRTSIRAYLNIKPDTCTCLTQPSPTEGLPAAGTGVVRRV